VETIDGGTRTIGVKVFDIPGDGIILSLNLVDRLNRVIFNVTGMEAFTLA
jgi:hypothetical protein